MVIPFLSKNGYWKKISEVATGRSVKKIWPDNLQMYFGACAKCSTQQFTEFLNSAMLDTGDLEKC
mgnify:CR=1 FL=1